MSQLDLEARTAARLGQELLARHDKYVAEAELTRSKMAAELERQREFARMVDELEQGNQDLEAENHRMMVENTALLRRLEELNGSLYQADSRNQELRDSLSTAEHSIATLSSRAQKTRALEGQMLRVQDDRDELHTEMLELLKMRQETEDKAQQSQRVIAKLQAELHELHSTAEPASPVPTPAPSSRPHYSSRVPSPLVLTTERTSDHDDLRDLVLQSQNEILALRSQLRALQEEEEVDHRTTPEPIVKRTVSQELHHHHHYHYHVAKPRQKSGWPTREVEGGSKRISPPDDTPQRPGPAANRAFADFGLASPPSTIGNSSTRRDSGFFSSCTSDLLRERATTFSHPATPSEELLPPGLDHFDATPTKLALHKRSTSEDNTSIARLLHDAGLPHEASPIVHHCLNSTVAESTPARALRRSMSHESILEDDSHDSPALLRAASHAYGSIGHRPRPTPLQGLIVSPSTTITGTSSAGAQLDVTAAAPSQLRSTSTTTNYNLLLRRAVASRRPSGGLGTSSAQRSASASATATAAAETKQPMSSASEVKSRPEQRRILSTGSNGKWGNFMRSWRPPSTSLSTPPSSQAQQQSQAQAQSQSQSQAQLRRDSIVSQRSTSTSTSASASTLGAHDGVLHTAEKPVMAAVSKAVAVTKQSGWTGPAARSDRPAILARLATAATATVNYTTAASSGGEGAGAGAGAGAAGEARVVLVKGPASRQVSDGAPRGAAASTDQHDDDNDNDSDGEREADGDTSQDALAMALGEALAA